jgi:bifunctional oligoribonuclease and PAP phosphatase NrnA
MTQKIRHDILSAIGSAKHVLITAHRSPDGDSLGSQLGLADYLESRRIANTIVNEGSIPGKYFFLSGIERVHCPGDFIAPNTPFDVVVVIECSNLQRIGKVQTLIPSAALIINIDHHQDNQPFGQINYKDTDASAAGEMIYDILVEGEATISAAMATHLYTAILTDTGRFHYSSTTPRCLRIAGKLVELGAHPDRITENVYYQMNPNVIRLTGQILSNIEYLYNGRLCLLTLDRKTMQAANIGEGDTEGLVNYSLYAQGVEVGILFTEIDEAHTKVSFRSQQALDVAQVAAHYGGGGHRNASGCMIHQPVRLARETVIAYLKDKLNGSV